MMLVRTPIDSKQRRHEMTTLVDSQIKQWAKTGGLNPCDFSLVNPASVNLRIGDHLEIESPGGGTYKVDISGNHIGNPFIVDPGEWLLSYSQEIVTLPPTMEAEVCLRSSAARAGWQHALAGYIDPGWSGQITLEFQNVRRYEVLPIYPGLQLCQLRLRRLDCAPDRDYSQTGRYQGDRGVQSNKDRTLI
jgi:dCTP deaminase